MASTGLDFKFGCYELRSNFDENDEKTSFQEGMWPLSFMSSTAFGALGLEHAGFALHVLHCCSIRLHVRHLIHFMTALYGPWLWF